MLSSRQLAQKSTKEQVKILNPEWHCFAGNAHDVLEQISIIEEAGVQELMLQWFDKDDIVGAEAFADYVGVRLFRRVPTLAVACAVVAGRSQQRQLPIQRAEPLTQSAISVISLPQTR